MKDKLVNLLKQIDANISEDHVDQIATMFETKLKEAKDSGFSEGIAKTEEIDADYAKKLDEAVETVKADYEKKLSKLDEEHASKLEEILEALDKDHSAKLEKLVEAIDNDHTQKLEQLVEAIDEDHTKKLEQLVEAIDEDHTNKLNHIVESYETHYEEMISEKVEDFIGTYIKESIPEQQIVESAKLEKLQEAVEGIRQILFVNDDYVQTEIKEAIVSAKETIDGEKDKVNRLMLENMDLKKKIMKNEASQMLEQKTASMKPALASFVKSYFDKEYDVKVISEKLDEAVKAFSSEEDTEKKQLVEEKERGSKPIDMPVEDGVDPTKIVESPQNSEDSLMDMYVNKYTRSRTPQRN
jgi:hypothetical protein